MDIETVLARQIAGAILDEWRSGPSPLRTAPDVLHHGVAIPNGEVRVPVGISNRHVHLSRHDMDTLFGPGSELTRMKALRQPGNFAAEETVTLRGPKGELPRVRILGPLRAETQVEISVADGIRLGVKPILRISGDLDGSPGLVLVGPRGSVTLDRGAIVAWRHVHMLPEEAAKAGLSDGDIVDALVEGGRGGVMGNVVIRVAKSSVPELHVDVEEANAFCLHNNDMVRIRKR